MLPKLHRETLTEQAEARLTEFIQERGLKPGNTLTRMPTLSLILSCTWQ